MPDPTGPDGPLGPTATAPTRAQVVAGRLMLLQGLIVLGFAAFYAYEMATGATRTLTVALTSGLLILVFGVGLLFMARGWLRGADWPRTPTMLWNGMLLPVAWSLHDAGRSSLGLAVGGLAIVTFVAALKAPMRDRSDA